MAVFMDLPVLGGRISRRYQEKVPALDAGQRSLWHPPRDLIGDVGWIVQAVPFRVGDVGKARLPTLASHPETAAQPIAVDAAPGGSHIDGGRNQEHAPFIRQLCLDGAEVAR